MNTEDRDAKAKEQARLERETAQDAAARLDSRISTQRKVLVGSSEKDQKEKARPSSTDILQRRPPAPLKNLSTMEADVAAKTRALPVSNHSAPMPGAYAAKSAPTPSGLSQMESDVAAKAKARPSAVRNEIMELQAKATARPQREASSARATLSQMEADAAAKSQARTGRSSSAETSVARAGLTQMELDVASKTMARASRTGHASLPGSVMERDPARSSESRRGLNQLEADVMTKHAGRPSAVAVPSALGMLDLEERIAYKTGIPLDDETKDESEPQAPQIRVQNVSKLTGIPAATLNASLEKYQATPELSALDRKDVGTPRGVDACHASDLEASGDAENRLAVAIEVKETAEKEFIPAAVEYDPDAKPPLFKNRRFRLYGFLACTLLVVIIAGAVGLIVTSEDSVAPSIEEVGDVDPRWDIGIQEQLELIVGSEKLSDKSSVHYKALEWIVLEDPMALTPADANLIQRYLLAVFYFKTHADADWLSCNKPKEGEDEICSYQKLVGIFPSEYRGVSDIRWLSNKHECSWVGLFCDEFDQVRHIELTGQNIKSELPVELAYFPFLQGISFAWNQFYGTIPPEYGEIKHLLDFEMHYNSLTGTIPSWPKAKNMQLLNVGANAITGTLPSDIKFLSNLKGFFFFENFLTGAFPHEFAELSLLTFIRMNSNYMTGTLISEIGTLSPNELWLHRMPLTGTIPREIGNMKGIQDLRLSNTNLHGTLPDEIYNLTDLWRLDLFTANFTGTISPNVGQLTDLVAFRISDNSFTGEVPAVLGNLTGLQRLWLEGNEFEGDVPSELCDLRGPYGLYQLTADCLPLPSTGEAAIACECCDVCCESETGLCEE